MAVIPKNPRNNCYFECEERIPLHHFPKPNKNIERFDAWTAVLDNDVKDKGNQYIYNQLRLCNKHFEDYFKLPSNRLTLNAVPTLNTRKDTSVGLTEDVTPASEMSPISYSLVLRDGKFTLSQTLVQEHLETNSIKQSSTLHLLDKCTLNQESVKEHSNLGSIKQSRNNLKVIKRLNQRVHRLLHKCKMQSKKIKAARRKSETKSLLKIIKNMPDSVKTFMTMQLKSKQKAKAKKFSVDEKIMAASILNESQKTYDYLKKIMVLPSKRTLQRFLTED